MDIARAVRHWRLPLCIALLTATIQALDLGPYLRYKRAQVHQGQWWRLVTGNLVHLGWMHLGRDLAGMVLIWILFGHYLRQRTWLFLLVVCGLGVTLGIYLFSPSIHWYVGLSGALFGMFSAGALCEWQVHRVRSASMLAGMVLLLLYTIVFGPLPGEEAGLGGHVVFQAHAYGACVGIGFMLCRGGLTHRLLARGNS